MLTTQIRLVPTLTVSNGIMYTIHAVVAWTAPTYQVPQRSTLENCILCCQYVCTVSVFVLSVCLCVLFISHHKVVLFKYFWTICRENLSLIKI